MAAQPKQQEENGSACDRTYAAYIEAVGQAG
jgi:hypothetical protein